VALLRVREERARLEGPRDAWFDLRERLSEGGELRLCLKREIVGRM
jgi:hypothetical protein